MRRSTFRTLTNFWQSPRVHLTAWLASGSAFALFLWVNLQTGPLAYAPMWDGAAWDNPAGIAWLGFKILFTMLALAGAARLVAEMWRFGGGAAGWLNPSA